MQPCRADSPRWYSTEVQQLTGVWRVTQSGVSDSFSMIVPIYADYGKGWVRLGAATIHGNTTTDLGRLDLPQPPKRLSVAAYKDVLALSVENKKQ